MTPEEFIKREQEIVEARNAYPGMEMGEAYRRWKAERGETATMLTTADKSVEVAKKVLKAAAKKPCTQPECDGDMVLESICGGCVEGKAGYKSKFTCQKCLYRELLKKDYLEILREMSEK